ncbi:exodeoxyribonuclease V subunit alpha [Shewanella algae]|uniref:exodeoxyribonuclease V subunit alpha n=1 Tax=Shewanella algae TaxID=38313 RepID=UPI001AAD3E56|nr:exodeoxyribonuclease V subunit alpha [Shewanella algae]MBO2556643.1 exodeoxyribonuclease V subunit alpha [Shewanella algae]MBO2573577.1 exodeoxyribonuclease V subunit alpha [Shewanella algae]
MTDSPSILQSSQAVTALLKQWEEQRLLTALDRHFALQMAAIHREPSPLFLLLCALLSRQLSSQHACLPLGSIAFDNPLAESHPSVRLNTDPASLELAVANFAAVGAPGEDKPLILDAGRLYLKRYYDFECRVARRLTAMAATEYPATDEVRRALDCLFLPPASHTGQATNDAAQADSEAQTDGETQTNRENSGKRDWQKVATATAYCRQLAVITGGPGTGKTTTVTKLLMLLCLGSEMNIRLVAPTGKAAARLTESIKASKQRLAKELMPFAAELNLGAIDKIPEEAATVHRLLGVIPGSHKFRHHQDNPLHLDLLIVDEASMVDLPMMDRLLDALPANARLILLGDQDQLASVEAGAVLADICAGLRHQQDWRMRYSAEFAATLTRLTGFDLSDCVNLAPGIGNNLCMLRHSHRFRGDAGIGVLAKAVNLSDGAAITAAWNGGYQELEWLEIGKQQQGLAQLLSQACEHYRDYLEVVHRPDIGADEIIARYNRFRLLCATRGGDFGVEGINRQLTQVLKQAGLIAPQQEFYPGRPLIIQSNDYNLGLFNGDIGVILPDRDSNRLLAHFIQADGSVLKVLPARLPGHETCFAMTVHKSQGSEFDSVALVLPPSPSPAQLQLLTKELIYTAITRAKQHFCCLGNSSVFDGACRRLTRRASGLADRLWQ